VSEGGIWKTMRRTRDIIYLLDVDAVACAAENEACSHCLCKPTGLVEKFMLAWALTRRMKM